MLYIFGNFLLELGLKYYFNNIIKSKMYGTIGTKKKPGNSHLKGNLAQAIFN